MSDSLAVHAAVEGSSVPGGHGNVHAGGAGEILFHVDEEDEKEEEEERCKSKISS